MSLMSYNRPDSRSFARIRRPLTYQKAHTEHNTGQEDPDIPITIVALYITPTVPISSAVCSGYGCKLQLAVQAMAMAGRQIGWITVALLVWLACSLALLPVAEARAKRRNKGPAPATGPCARVSNQAMRRRWGLVGTPSIQIDHIYDRSRALKLGLFPHILANLELAPKELNQEWGKLLVQGRLAEMERSKRKFYGVERFEEAIQAVQFCNQRYRYT